MAAKNSKRQARRTSGGSLPGWAWLVIGMVLGVILFLLASGMFQKDGDGFARFGPTPNPNAQPVQLNNPGVDSIEGEMPPPAGAAGGTPDISASSSANDEPKYDFYILLPGREVPMSDAEIAATARAEEERRARAALTQTPVNSLPAPLPESGASAPQTVATTTGTTPAATTAPAVGASLAAASAETDMRYILQAGSFGNVTDAEATKARVALLGLSARVESAEISGKTVYRVRTGPYGSAGELSEAKQKLSNGGLPALAIRSQ
ncbi:MAG: SPOR domain-containing protein [Xanthomonadaceae bacterium]|jgi:cell division protein FtsN|nr:SPOR domain-containing protein [Xanthomonadaceae bacterium]